MNRTGVFGEVSNDCVSGLVVGCNLELLHVFLPGLVLLAENHLVVGILEIR